jgi:hypothetical protein
LFLLQFDLNVFGHFGAAWIPRQSPVFLKIPTKRPSGSSGPGPSVIVTQNHKTYQGRDDSDDSEK